jgi:hypothetical protein
MVFGAMAVGVALEQRRRADDSPASYIAATLGGLAFTLAAIWSAFFH